MKDLIIYYSLTGDTERIAEIIRQETGADIIRLKPADEPDKSSWSRYFWGGKSVFFDEKPLLDNEFPDFDLYDRIFIGTPVWSFNITPAVNTLLSMFDFAGKKIYPFVSYEGFNRNFKIIKEKLPKADVRQGGAFLKSSKNLHDEVVAWLDELQV